MNITYLINKYPDKQWDWYQLSRNPNITIQDILSRPDKQWDWACLSRYANITIKDVLNNPDKPWNWSFYQLIKIKINS